MKSIRVCFREDDSLPKQPEIDWLWGALQVGGGWGLWLQRDGRESRSVGREEVWGEREVGNEKKQGRETRWKKKKEKRKWEMKNWGEIFAVRKKKNLRGKLVL